MTDAVTAFIKKALFDQLEEGIFTVLPLAGDASSRRYSRINSGQKSWVLMEWEPFVPETFSLLSVQKHFKKNHVLVPEVVAYSGELGIMLYTDLGDVTLEQEFYRTRNPSGVMGYYRMAIDELLKIHFNASRDRSPCVAFQYEFDVEKLSWEMNWTRQHLLEGLLNFKGLTQELQKEFIQLSTILHEKPKCIQHRDYHSRNLMVFQNKLHVIDFQDARLGLVQYDLVSLLRDAYVPIPHYMERELLDYYIGRAKSDYDHSWDREEFMYLYEVQSVQRLFKAVGSFASFWMLRHDKRYLKYIPATLKRVKNSLDQLGPFENIKKALNESGAYQWSEGGL